MRGARLPSVSKSAARFARQSTQLEPIWRQTGFNFSLLWKRAGVRKKEALPNLRTGFHQSGRLDVGGAKIRFISNIQLH